MGRVGMIELMNKKQSTAHQLFLVALNEGIQQSIKKMEIESSRRLYLIIQIISCVILTSKFNRNSKLLCNTM